jgi:hypothetical protein
VHYDGGLSLSLSLSLSPFFCCCCCGAPHLCRLFFIVFVWEFLFARFLCFESCFCFLPILKWVLCFEPGRRTRTRPSSLWLGPWRVPLVKKARACEWKEGGHEGLLVCSSMSNQTIMLAHWIADKEALMFTLGSKQVTGSTFRVGGSLPSGWTEPEQVRYAVSFDLWRRKLEKSRLSTSLNSCLSWLRLPCISCSCLLALSFILCGRFQEYRAFVWTFFYHMRCVSESMDTCSCVDRACIYSGSDVCLNPWIHVLVLIIPAYRSDLAALRSCQK